MIVFDEWEEKKLPYETKEEISRFMEEYRKDPEPKCSCKLYGLSLACYQAIRSAFSNDYINEKECEILFNKYFYVRYYD